ncbi:LysR substrate-binding domain-containing protein [Subtercola endophyticus]|uniref:LysR substrate-binding domain-containing protein n=1 Tax=Subtercola endophyticus TaxID=2895559 RepID=UPI001E3117A1|nr:LysR substrate-binding domain-containing protein [Subtercola endophyticus]UFS59234.1 LysR substrate-binding domain-containing protein [Subtercola endophyticus]
MDAGRVKLERQKLERLAALAAAFAGTPEGDAVVAAVDALSRSLRESRRRASAAGGGASSEPGSPGGGASGGPGSPGSPGSAGAATEGRPSATGSRAEPGEPLVVALAADDALAGREAVAVTELADRHLLHNPDEVPAWRDVATELVGPTIRTSRSFALGPLATLDQQLDHVAAGHGIIIVPRSRAESAPRTDVVLVLVGA